MINLNIGLFGGLGISFIILKLCGVIAWSWAWVLAPFWLPFMLVIMAIIVMIGSIAFFAFITTLFEK